MSVLPSQLLQTLPWTDPVHAVMSWPEDANRTVSTAKRATDCTLRSCPWTPPVRIGHKGLLWTPPNNKLDFVPRIWFYRDQRAFKSSPGTLCTPPTECLKEHGHKPSPGPQNMFIKESNSHNPLRNPAISIWGVLKPLNHIKVSVLQREWLSKCNLTFLIQVYNVTVWCWEIYVV